MRESDKEEKYKRGTYEMLMYVLEEEGLFWNLESVPPSRDVQPLFKGEIFAKVNKLKKKEEER